MYLGKIVEQAPTEELFAAPKRPYTQALLSAAVRPVGRDHLDACHLVDPGAETPALRDLVGGSAST